MLLPFIDGSLIKCVSNKVRVVTGSEHSVSCGLESPFFKFSGVNFKDKPVKEG